MEAVYVPKVVVRIAPPIETTMDCGYGHETVRITAKITPIHRARERAILVTETTAEIMTIPKANAKTVTVPEAIVPTNLSCSGDHYGDYSHS